MQMLVMFFQSPLNRGLTALMLILFPLRRRYLSSLHLPFAIVSMDLLVNSLLSAYHQFYPVASGSDSSTLPLSACSLPSHWYGFGLNEVTLTQSDDFELVEGSLDEELNGLAIDIVLAFISKTVPSMRFWSLGHFAFGKDWMPSKLILF